MPFGWGLAICSLNSENTIEDKLLKQSPLYEDMMEEGTEKGRGEGAENTIITALTRVSVRSRTMYPGVCTVSANETVNCWTN